MNDNERAQLEAGIRMSEYAAQTPSQFPANSKAAQLRATLTTGVSELNAHATAQASHRSSAREATTNKDAARKVLLKDIKNISRAAAAMALDLPSIADKFRMPHGNNNQDLLITARAFAADAVPLKDDFIDNGLAADFLTRLEADITAFEQALATHNQRLEAQTASTAAFKAKLKQIIKVMKQLDTLLSIQLEGDVEKLTAWRTASRIRKTRKSASPSTPAPETPPAQ
jgi:hypothetical protein